MELAFTQFLRPDGRREPVLTDIDDRFAAKVGTILGGGFRFEIEVLMTGQIHMTISDPLADYCNRLCANDEAVTKNIESMIEEFDLDWALQHRARLEE